MRKTLNCVLLLSIIVLANTITGFAQQISGKVSDNAQQLEFVVVALLNANDSSLVSSTTTDQAGLFQFSNLPGNAYFLSISYVGYQPYYSGVLTITGDSSHFQKDILLEEISREGEEVVIKARKPLIEQEAGKMTVDVQNSSLSSGLMALDLLRRMPGVTVDNEGNIFLKGKPNVLILFDGKPTYMSAKQISALLKAMPSSQIANIEIVTAPSAKYDAQGDGGVIDIHLKKSLSSGFNGSLFATLGQGVYYKQNYGISLGYNVKKWRFNAGYDYTNNKGLSAGYQNRTFGDINNKEKYNQSNYYRVPTQTNSYRLSADYQANKHLELGVNTKGLFNNYTWDGSSSSTLTDSTNTVKQLYEVKEYSPGIFRSFSAGGNAKYKFDTLGQQLKLDVDYLYYDEKYTINSETRLKENGTENLALFRSNLPFDVSTLAAQLDYEKKFLKQMKVEAGAKWVSTSLNNNLTYDVQQTTPVLPVIPSRNQFNYKDQVSAGYLQCRWDSTKWSVEAGLRLEHWQANGVEIYSDNKVKRDQTQLFPMLAANYQLHKSHKLSFSANRRIRRPSYMMLNPTSYFLDGYNYYTGNPDLQPQLTQNFELSHSFKSALVTTLNYTTAKNFIYEYAVSQRTDGSNISDMGPVNIPLSENIGAAVSLYLPITPKWTCQLYGNVYYIHLAGYLSNAQTSFNRSYWNATFNTTQEFTLPKAFILDFTAQYTAPQLVGYTINNQLGMISLGLKKDVFKGRGTVKINAQDIFYTFKYTGHTSYDGYESDYLYRWDNRVVNLSFTWKLGSGWFLKDTQSTGKDEKMLEGKN